MSEGKGDAPDSEIALKSKLDILTDAVNELYEYRDHYFENHSLENASNKAQDIKDKLELTLQKFEENKDVELTERAQYFYLQGKAYNVTPNYNPKAEDVLSRAIKLDVKLFNAWNELGESFWKKENILEAKNCFQGALKHSKNKKSLRNLSMVLRMEPPGTPAERIKNIEEGMKVAKQAVELDPTDGASWSVLGNAYLSSFFSIAQNPTVLNLCKSAYTQAEKDAVARNNPDLHYNKAIVAKYEEDYRAALESFSRASQLEPSWLEPASKRKQLESLLERTHSAVRSKGRIKGKKLAKMLAGMGEKHLGPYRGGVYRARNGQEIELKGAGLGELEEGLNEGRVVLGVVVSSLQDEDNVPFTFIMVDKQETSVAVTVYNLAQGKGVLIGDYVAIPEPFLTHVRIKCEDEEYAYDSIRVVSPLVMVVNGRKLDKTKQSGLQFTTFSMAE